MSIHKRKLTSFRHYISADFGKLVVPKKRDQSPQMFPQVLGGQVGVKVSRQEAAQGLKTWREMSRYMKAEADKKAEVQKKETELKTAAKVFLETGVVSNALLGAYDQDGKKIPSKEMPYWEPEEFIGEPAPFPENEIWEEAIHNMPETPRLHHQLPEEVPASRMVSGDPNKELRFLGTFYSEGQKTVEIPFDHIEGGIIARNALKIIAPLLKTVGSDIMAHTAKTAKFPILETVRGSVMMDQCDVIMPKLREVEGINAMMSKNGTFPELRIAENICLPCSKTLDLPKLTQCGELMGMTKKLANLPELRHVKGDLDLGFIKKIHAPKLEFVGGNLYADYDPDFKPANLTVLGKWETFEKRVAQEKEFEENPEDFRMS